MSRTYVPTWLREQVAAAAGCRCGYCRSSEKIVGAPMEIDHLIPEARGGPTECGTGLWSSTLASSACKARGRPPWHLLAESAQLRSCGLLWSDSLPCNEGVSARPLT